MFKKFVISISCVVFYFSYHCAIAQTTNIPNKPKHQSLDGIHFVFDASESICGYFAGPQNKNPLLALIKTAVSGKNPSIGNEVFLLKQMVKSKPVASRDIVVAPSNIQTLSLNIKSSGTQKNNSCQPFNGVYSNIELIFDEKSPTQDADAVLLVTDAQLVNTDRDRFVKGYANWIESTLLEGKQPHAGAALVEVEFAGRYFPIANDKTSYLLDTHNRPLLLFWFAKSEKHLKQIESVVSSFAPSSLVASKDAFTQHFLPSFSLGLAGFQGQPNFNPPLSSLIQKKPSFAFKKYDSGRADLILSNCLQTTIDDKSINITAESKCRDGKPLFDGVTDIIMTLKLESNPYFTSAIKPSGKSGDIIFNLKRDLIGKSIPFELQHTLTESAGSKLDLTIYSLDTDNCGNNSMTQCREQLVAKTYQLDVLFAQLFQRQKEATSHVLDSLNSAKYSIEFKLK